MIVSLAAAFALTFLVLLGLTRGSFAQRVLDHPNERSLHTRPVGRSGGLAIMAGIACGWLLLPGTLVAGCLAAALVLAAISFLDDLRGLPVAWRLLFHIVVAAALAWSIGLSGLILLSAILGLVWMTNLYNFMDGSDGLAGGMALFGFGSYGAAAWLHGNLGFATLNWSISASTLAFLCFNFHPARIFMGDVGSIPLGFLAAALGLLGWQQGVWPLWLPLLVFSPFVVDASVTLLKRLLHGEKVWQAHREHYYQRLVQLGWGHHKTALAEYGLMLATGGSAVWLLAESPTHWMLLVFAWGLIYLILMASLDWRWTQAHRNRDSGRQT